MQSLITLFTDSLQIWSRNFSLVYIFLLALLLFSLVIQQAGIPTLEWRWLLLAAVLLLLFGAIMAGWFNMVATACARFLDNKAKQSVAVNGEPQRENPALDSLRLFQDFLPGISQYFLKIALGYFFQFGVGTLLLMTLEPLWVKNEALLQKMTTMQPTELSQLNDTLSLAERINLGQLGLGLLVVLLVYSLFSMLIMLWPAFVVFYGNNPLLAYWRSVRQFIADPLRLLAISLLLFSLRVPLVFITLTNGGQSPILAAVAQMLTLILEIYTAVLIFAYVYQAVGKPTPLPEKDQKDASPDSNSPNIP